MSQSKVDKKKYEKKHRKEILRKQKIKKIIAITVPAMTDLTPQTIILMVIMRNKRINMYLLRTFRLKKT